METDWRCPGMFKLPAYDPVGIAIMRFGRLVNVGSRTVLSYLERPDPRGPPRMGANFAKLPKLVRRDG